MANEDLAKDISYLDILDNLDAAVAVFDAKGNHVFVNTALVNMRNIPRAEFLKMNVHEFLPVLENCVFDLVMKEKRRLSRLQYYRDFQKVDSIPRIRMTTGTPIFDHSGNIRYVINVMQDIGAFDEKYHRLLKESKVLSAEQVPAETSKKREIIAKSREFLQLLAVAKNIAPLDSTVLLCGESGCGKEILAEYIYHHSRRAEKRMVTVNCAAVPESLIEAELFGYEKGAFTGANREGKTGLIETADGGTLFLDEINSLPLSVQGKLLRTLEDKSIQKIGSTRTKRVDFRLIAATNRDLTQMVKAGSFREDLYYRLQVIPLTIPPLRERRDDIIPLCLHFISHFSDKYDIPKRLSDSVLEELKRYSWPGNVREVRNFAERVVVMTPRSEMEISNITNGLLAFDPDIPESRQEAVEAEPEPPTEKERSRQRLPAPRSLDRDTVLAALAECGGNRAQTAAYLGISLRKLQYKIKEYHISGRCRYDEGS